jgi:hypothetical protein
MNLERNISIALSKPNIDSHITHPPATCAKLALIAAAKQKRAKNEQ